MYANVAKHCQMERFEFVIDSYSGLGTEIVYVCINCMAILPCGWEGNFRSGCRTGHAWQYLHLPAQ